jgi:hypothetical protein
MGSGRGVTSSGKASSNILTIRGEGNGPFYRTFAISPSISLLSSGNSKEGLTLPGADHDSSIRGQRCPRTVLKSVADCPAHAETCAREMLPRVLTFPATYGRGRAPAKATWGCAVWSCIGFPGETEKFLALGERSHMQGSPAKARRLSRYIARRRVSRCHLSPGCGRRRRSRLA